MVSGTVVILVLGCALLVILGGLVGHELSRRSLNRDIRRQATLRKQLGEQWRAIEAFYSTQHDLRCPECGAPVNERGGLTRVA
jgi:ABC-type bacteriocin/lantibiotic exporter with double-glycine peptidase domain